MSVRGGSGRWLLLATAVVVVAVVIAAVAIIGPPAKQREARLDARRVQDLGRIESAIARHAGQHGTLPADLPGLASRPGQRISTADPVDGTPYDYRITGPLTYRLCATFSTDTADPRATTDRVPDEWSHGAGRQCFERRYRAPRDG